MPGMVHGAWCHIEIPAASVDAAKRFYGGLFGWKFTDVPEMKYVIYSSGDGEVGGGFFNPPEGTPKQITNYVTVTDLDESVNRVNELGGKICSERMEVPGMGWFRIVSDPEGNNIGLWQAAQRRPAPAPAKAKKAAPKAKKASKTKPAKKKPAKRRR
jgi:predicted enzyme related to lactoylglutathione lyase